MNFAKLPYAAAVPTTQIHAACPTPSAISSIPPGDSGTGSHVTLRFAVYRPTYPPPTAPVTQPLRATSFTLASMRL